jgi:hypothetical protein
MNASSRCIRDHSSRHPICWRRSRERIREQDLRAGFERIGEGQIDLCCNGEGERGFFFFTPKLAMEEKVQ